MAHKYGTKLFVGAHSHPSCLAAIEAVHDKVAGALDSGDLTADMGKGAPCLVHNPV
jgi:hypothetical protein